MRGPRTAGSPAVTVPAGGGSTLLTAGLATAAEGEQGY
jgi:hypothetical protein